MPDVIAPASISPAAAVIPTEPVVAATAPRLAFPLVAVTVTGPVVAVTASAATFPFVETRLTPVPPSAAPDRATLAPSISSIVVDEISPTVAVSDAAPAASSLPVRSMSRADRVALVPDVIAPASISPAAAVIPTAPVATSASLIATFPVTARIFAEATEIPGVPSPIRIELPCTTSSSDAVMPRSAVLTVSVPVTATVPAVKSAPPNRRMPPDPVPTSRASTTPSRLRKAPPPIAAADMITRPASDRPAAVWVTGMVSAPGVGSSATPVSMIKSVTSSS